MIELEEEKQQKKLVEDQKQEKKLLEDLKHDRKLPHKGALEILIRLYIGYKIARIFEPNNLSFQLQIKLLHDVLQNTLKNEGWALFSIRQNSLYFNSIRLRFSIANYHVFKFIVDEFKKREIGALGFQPEFSQEELRSFILLLAKELAKASMPFEEFVNETRKRGINNITLERISPLELTASKQKFAARVYFLSILHLKELFEKERLGEKFNLNVTRRLMQSIFNHIVENESFIYGLTNIKNYDEYTLNHSVNVCILSIALGRRLGLARNELVNLGIAAFFHDLGKLDTPKEILDKPDKLTDEERDIIQKHPYQGAQKLVHLKGGMPDLPLEAVHVSLEHHSWHDLSGYPKYFKRNAINLYSKIVNITDYFDAITTKRPYRKKTFTRSEALSLMLEKSGTGFDSIILKVFANMMGVFPIGSLVSLDTGELALVLETNPEPPFILRPKVKLITDTSGNRIDGDVVDLTEIDTQTKKYKRTILRSLDPHQYNIEVSDYFLAMAQ